MNTRRLGDSDLYITPVGFGAWAIGGGGWEVGWGAQDDRESISAIREALDAGINWIDTAAVYGLETVARALEGVLRRAQAIAPITSLQPRYSLVHRDIEDEILPFVAREGIGVIAYSPMASGLLTGAMTRERIAGLPAGDWRKMHADFREPQLSRNLQLVSLLQTSGKRHGGAPGEVAVAWVLRDPAVTGAFVGARRPAQVRGLSRAADFRLSPGEIAEIEALSAQAVG